MKIRVGSLNPVKVDAVKEMLEPLGHDVMGVQVLSEVSEQPFSDLETVQGAENRAKAALTLNGDIGIGLEAGLERFHGQLYLVNWGVLTTVCGQFFYAGGTRIPLPLELENSLESGLELAEVMDKYAKKQDVRSKEGAIGILTAYHFNRKENFNHIITLLWGQFVYRKHLIK